MSPMDDHSPKVSAFVTGIIGTLLAILAEWEAIDAKSSFAAITVLMLAYLWGEVRRLRRRHPQQWLVNPIVLCSLFTFVLSYGVSNILFFLPADSLEGLSIASEIRPSMVKLMWLALLGAIAMWLGYWSAFAARFSRLRSIAHFHACFLPQTNTLRRMAIPGLLIVSITARLIQIRLGVFGYSSDVDTLTERGAITQYLSIAASLGKVALALAALQFYSGCSSRHAKWWMFGILVFEVAAGFLSGMKSGVLMPFVIILLCRYLRVGRLSKAWLVMVFVAVVAAYAVIEPFRIARYEDRQFSGTSLGNIVETMLSARSFYSRELGPLYWTILARGNLSYIGSFGIEFADAVPYLPEGSPEFLKDILLAPLHAWIPRLVWETKPLGTLGLWYTQVVLGMGDIPTSTAMGPFTYLYFAGGGMIGGSVAVFIGFFLIGILQRAMFFLLQPAVSIPGATVFLAMLSTFVVIDSAINGIVVNFFRMFPLAILLQFLLFRWRARTVPALSPAPAKLSWS